MAEKWLREICGNCGKNYGAHHGGHAPWPYGYCPDPECSMDWEKGPGTVWKATGTYEDETGVREKGSES